MEQILNLYKESYNEDYPVVCFDERPCFLIGDTQTGLAMKQGSVAKEHYSYSKHGACSILGAIEPKTGFRLAHVRERRTKKEFALFMDQLADSYPKAIKIRVVLDNLNTHHKGAFYEHFGAKRAGELARRFEFHFTPKSSSWLNMMEIEYSALARQCLKRRIPDQHEIERQTNLFLKNVCTKKSKSTGGLMFAMQERNSKGTI